MEKVRIGFVGTGGIAAHHMGNLKKLEAVQFAAMCDVVEERAAEPAEEHDCPAFTDYRRMLDEVEMDALYVCVPPFAHEDAELRAAERGKQWQPGALLDLRSTIRRVAVTENWSRGGGADSGHDWPTCGRSPCACGVTDSPRWGYAGIGSGAEPNVLG